MPGRCAAPPGAAMMTLRPAPAARGRSTRAGRACGGPRTIRASWGCQLVETRAASRIVGHRTGCPDEAHGGCGPSGDDVRRAVLDQRMRSLRTASPSSCGGSSACRPRARSRAPDGLVELAVLRLRPRAPRKHSASSMVLEMFIRPRASGPTASARAPSPGPLAGSASPILAKRSPIGGRGDGRFRAKDVSP
jgi:hypothetical protein